MQRVTSEENLRADARGSRNMLLAPNDSFYYKDLLRKTLRDHEAQGTAKGTYKVQPDNRITLWNMIDKWKTENEGKKERQIAQKSANAAQHFRQVNNA